MTTLPEIKEIEIGRGFSLDKKTDKSQVCLILNRASVSRSSDNSFSKDDHHPYQNLLPVTSISNNSLNINVFGVDDVTKVYSHDVFCAPDERNNSVNSEKSRVGLFSCNSAGVIGTKIRNKSISFVFSNNCDEYEDINVFVETKSPATIHSNKN